MKTPLRLTYGATLAILAGTKGCGDARGKDRIVVTCGGKDLGETIRRASATVVHYLTPEELGGSGYTHVRVTIEACCADCTCGKVYHGVRKAPTLCKACKGTGAPSVVATYISERTEYPVGIQGYKVLPGQTNEQRNADDAHYDALGAALDALDEVAS